MKDTHKIVGKSNETISDKKIDGTEYSEALKCSNLENFKAENCTLIGGSEDCLDVVRGEGEFDNISFRPQRKTRQSITFKGSCKVNLKNSTFYGRAKKYDISVGDFTIYDAVEKRSESILNIDNCKAYDKNGNQRKVKILSLHGKVNKSNGNYDVKTYPSILIKIYFFFSKIFTSKSRKKEARQNLENSPDVIPQ